MKLGNILYGVTDANFEEAKHPRGESGEFAATSHSPGKWPKGKEEIKRAFPGSEEGALRSGHSKNPAINPLTGKSRGLPNNFTHGRGE
jgi:hypothetical protein